VRFERDVVVDELPEVRVGGRDAGVSTTHGPTGVLHGPAETDEVVPRALPFGKQVAGFALEIPEQEIEVPGIDRPYRRESPGTSALSAFSSSRAFCNCSREMVPPCPMRGVTSFPPFPPRRAIQRLPRFVCTGAYCSNIL
jgi:hypothetical protein